MPSNGPSPLRSGLMLSNASASVLYAAETSPGIGTTLAFDTSLVSTCSRVEKNVERSGRRGGLEGSVVEGLGTLCSTGGNDVNWNLWWGGWKELGYLRKMPC